MQRLRVVIIVKARVSEPTFMGKGLIVEVKYRPYLEVRKKEQNNETFKSEKIRLYSCKDSYSFKYTLEIFISESEYSICQ